VNLSLQGIEQNSTGAFFMLLTPVSPLGKVFSLPWTIIMSDVLATEKDGID
jgi:hypothetical protein